MRSWGQCTLQPGQGHPHPDPPTRPTTGSPSRGLPEYVHLDSRLPGCPCTSAPTLAHTPYQGPALRPTPPPSHRPPALPPSRPPPRPSACLLPPDPVPSFPCLQEADGISHSPGAPSMPSPSCAMSWCPHDPSARPVSHPGAPKTSSLSCVFSWCPHDPPARPVSSPGAPTTPSPSCVTSWCPRDPPAHPVSRPGAPVTPSPSCVFSWCSRDPPACPVSRPVP